MIFFVCRLVLFCGMSILAASIGFANEVMEGFPPTSDSQVTKANYLAPPFNRWAFRNAGAPLNTLMVPRGGTIHMKVKASGRCLAVITPTGCWLYRATTCFLKSTSMGRQKLIIICGFP